MRAISLILLLSAVPLFAQDQPSTTENPLAILKDQVKAVLENAGLPFTEDQEKAIILMMEDRRKASEDLFGNLMDFSAVQSRARTPTSSSPPSTGCATSF